MRAWLRKLTSRANLIWFAACVLIGSGIGFVVHVVIPFALRPALTEEHEIVMCEGMEILAHDDTSEIRITALGMTKRRYQVEEVDMSVTLYPREARWYGSFGLIRPHGNFSMHAVLEEAHRYLADARDMLYELEGERGADEHVALSSDGIVVEWVVRRDPANPGRRALLVDVMQYFLGNERASITPPQGIGTVEVSAAEPCDAQRAPRGYVASSEQRIEGRLYAGRALDLMKEWGISPAAVEAVIRKGDAKALDEGQMLFRGRDAFERTNRPEFVVIEEDGRVLDVTP